VYDPSEPGVQHKPRRGTAGSQQQEEGEDTDSDVEEPSPTKKATELAAQALAEITDLDPPQSEKTVQEEEEEKPLFVYLHPDAPYPDFQHVLIDHEALRTHLDQGLQTRHDKFIASVSEGGPWPVMRDTGALSAQAGFDALWCQAALRSNAASTLRAYDRLRGVYNEKKIQNDELALQPRDQANVRELEAEVKKLKQELQAIPKVDVALALGKWEEMEKNRLELNEMLF
jgi:hypothetical protein